MLAINQNIGLYLLGGLGLFFTGAGNMLFQQKIGGINISKSFPELTDA